MQHSEASLMECILQSMKSNSDMVVLEAAKAMCDLPQATPKEIAPIVSGKNLTIFPLLDSQNYSYS